MLRDRGTIKWTSLMLPEHVELLKEMWQEETKLQKPEMDAQELEMMNRKLKRADHYKDTVQLSVYHNGEIVTITGKIKQIDLNSKIIRLENGHTDRTISFSNIIEVDTIE